MSRDSFVIRNRSEFDAFWVSGVELGQMQTAEVLQVHSQATTEPRRQLEAGSSAIPNLLEDPPVTAQVWWKYATEPLDSPVDLLIAPGGSTTPVGQTARQGLSSGATARLIRERVIGKDLSLESSRLSEGFGFVAVDLTYEHMVTRLLPLTPWKSFLETAKGLSEGNRRAALRSYRRVETTRPDLGWLGWFLHLLAICGGRTQGGRPAEITYGSRSRALSTINGLLKKVRLRDISIPIGRVTFNREVRASVHRSRRTVKADAARDLFGVRCDNIRWAVVDSGIDARHDWFRLPRPNGGELWELPFQNDGETFNFTRIVEAYDFARQRASGAMSKRDERGEMAPTAELPGDVPIALALGEKWYEPPRNGHGTHVAGIIGGSGGLCPDLRLYDYRVLEEDGSGNEFAVVAALRHILDLTQRAGHSDPTGRSRDLPIHGVNLSLALDADVTSDACGWSLACRVCDELVRAGVVVVVSAGNTGFEDRTGGMLSTGQDYRTVSITDPGNTERVITVGSTDADRPKEYGVSFFSARGPTADGRAKPDLVAPGNSITSSFGYKRDDEDRRNVAAALSGTSMAAAHVSGCAALLLARHRELIGKPDQVKSILMDTATNLQRDRNFQGAGLVDALRALQSV